LPFGLASPFAPASCLRSPAKAGFSTTQLVIHLDLGACKGKKIKLNSSFRWNDEQGPICSEIG
jgi:hypothetical protein